MRTHAWMSWVVLWSSLANAAAGESSFTPTSLKVPIWRITLSAVRQGESASAPSDECLPPEGAGGEAEGGQPWQGNANCSSQRGPATLYQCAGDTEEACLVDLADDAALAALFAGQATVFPGTYLEIQIETCGPNNQGPQNDNTPNYFSYLKGQVTLGGNTYYTKEQAEGSRDPLTQDPSKQGYVKVGFSGCGHAFPLYAPLTVAEGDSIEVNAFFSLKDISWATLSQAALPSGCADNGIAGAPAYNNGATLSVCMSYPNLAPYIGSVAPTLERFLISESSAPTNTAGGQVLLISSPNNEPIGGFTRRYYSESSIRPSGNYDTPLKSITRNGDGSYAVKNYGGWMMGDNGSCVTDDQGRCAISDYYLFFPQFSRASTSSGTLSIRNGNSLADIFYESRKTD